MAGGWALARDLSEVTLREVHESKSLGAYDFCPGQPSPGCLAEQAVNERLDATFVEAEALLLARFGEISLADIWSSVRAPFGAYHQGKEDADRCMMS